MHIMDSGHIVRQVKSLAEHADAAQYFAGLLGNALDALWKSKESYHKDESVEVSFKENKPGEFEIYWRLKGGAPPFDDLIRLARGNVVKRQIVFNSLTRTPQSIKDFFEVQGWEMNTMSIEVEVR